jgi:hypothetical protein
MAYALSSFTFTLPENLSTTFRAGASLNAAPRDENHLPSSQAKREDELPQTFVSINNTKFPNTVMKTITGVKF